MDIRCFADMDPAILYSLLNTRLRNACCGLDDLARRHDIDGEALQRHMARHGYGYDDAQRQFRPGC